MKFPFIAQVLSCLVKLAILAGKDLIDEPNFTPRIYIHDAWFRPDRVLRISARVHPIDCSTRYSVLINGSIPGPELRFREGQRVWIRVYNDIPDENVTIHWHGLTQRMSPFSDGTPVVSQWPIPPLHYFDYEFQLQHGDAGTYFYHSHVGFQAVTAFGPLIVEERLGHHPPIGYDAERTLIFSDIFLNNDSYILDGLQGTPFHWSGEARNIAVNGHSRFINATPDERGRSCSFAVIRVKPDRAYRFRFIGAMALSQIYIGIEKHRSMALFEVDGQYVAPLEVNHVEVHTGQRYSVILETKTRKELRRDRVNGITQYWIQIETRSRPSVTMAFAVLQYDDSPDEPDDFTWPAVIPLILPSETFTRGWLENVLMPEPSRPYRDSCPQLNEVTRRIIIDVQEMATSVGGTGLPWYDTIPKEPYLISLYKDDVRYFPNYALALRNGGFDPTTRTFPAKLGEVLEIVWQNLGSSTSGTVDTHPLHAHGDHIWDIASGSGRFDPFLAEALLQEKLNNGGPIKRDTTNLYRTPLPETSKPGQRVSWRAWRLRVLNPGVWMIHCHMLPHMMLGMQTVFVFGDREDLKVLTPAQAAGYLQYGGAAYGNATYNPRVLHYWHDGI